jgi:hypothetical protein
MEIKMKKVIALSLAFLSTNVLADSVSVLAAAHYQVCSLNRQCSMSSQHDIEIHNSTGVDHLYYYSYSLCDDKGKCAGVGNKITVKANSTWNNNYNAHLFSTFRWTGSHTITAKTTVTGYENHEGVNSNFVIVN